MSEPPRRRSPELLMPVPDEQALALAQIEALRAIRDSVASQAKHTEALTAEVREQGKAIADVRERVIRIEVNKVHEEVAELKGEVEILKEERLRREGAVGVGNWLVTKGPSLLMLLGFVVTLVAILAANNKL